MDQLNDYADSRLLRGCIYCNGVAENMQRLLVTQMTIPSEDGGQQNIQMIINAWIDV